MISLHYFVIPSSAEFAAHPNRYTNALPPIHICLRNIAESIAGAKWNFNETCFSPSITYTANFSLFKYTRSPRKKVCCKHYYSIAKKCLNFCIPNTTSFIFICVNILLSQMLLFLFSVFLIFYKYYYVIKRRKWLFFFFLIFFYRIFRMKYDHFRESIVRAYHTK